MLRKYSTKRILFFFFVIDWLGTIFMVILAGLLRSRIGLLPRSFILLLQHLNITAGEILTGAQLKYIFPVQLLLLIAIIWPFFLLVFSVYDGRRNETIKNELLNVFLAVCVSMMTLAGILYFSYRETSRVMLLLFFFMDLILLLGSRFSLWAYRQNRTRQPLVKRRAALVVGAGPVGQNVVVQLKKYAWADIKVVGYIDDDPQKQGCECEGVPVLSTLDHARDVVSRYDIQVAIVALPLRAHERLLEICVTLQQMPVRVYVIPDLFSLSFPNASLDGFGGIPVIDLGKPGIQGWQRVVKRVFDVIAVTVGLLIISPLLLFIAVLIKLDSPGAVIYKQKRVGENSRSFEMYKFRSMRVDADHSIHKAHVTRLIQQNLSPEQMHGDQGGSLKLENDPRITRVGRLIRKTSLDELPQLFNVLLGDMSLVGPRPSLPYEFELYQDWHKRRLEAMPGITGLWQVKGRNRVSFDEMVRMDLEYIRQQSFWLDITILLQTPLALISTKGAG